MDRKGTNEMFIKLTLHNDKFVWVNVFNVELIGVEFDSTKVWFRGDEYPIEVKESPEEIVEMIKEMKK